MPSSMSVAWSSSAPSEVKSLIPASVWIALRVETPRTAMPSADTSLSREIESFIELVVVVGGVDTSTATDAAASDAGSPADDRLCIVSSVSVGACSGERGAYGVDDIGGAVVTHDVG